MLEIELLFGVAGALGKFVNELLHESVDFCIKSAPRDNAVHEAPFEGLCGGNFLIQQKDLSGPAFTHNEWEPLRGPCCSHAPAGSARMPDDNIVGGHCEIAQHLELDSPPTTMPFSRAMVGLPRFRNRSNVSMNTPIHL